MRKVFKGDGYIAGIIFLLSMIALTMSLAGTILGIVLVLDPTQKLWELTIPFLLTGIPLFASCTVVEYCFVED